MSSGRVAFASTLFLLAALAALAACAGAPQQAPPPRDGVGQAPALPTTLPTQLEAAAESPLIPRRVLLSDPDRALVRLSPDGNQLSFVAPVGGALNVWVGSVDEPEAARAVTDDDHRGIRWYAWAYTNRHIVYAQDFDGDENFALYAVDLETGEETRLTPESEVRAWLLQASPDHPEELLVQLNDRDPRYHDVHRVNLVTGESVLALENPGFAALYADDDLVVRLAVRSRDDGGEEWLVPAEAAGAGSAEGAPEGWVVRDVISMEDAMTTRFDRFDRAGEVGYAIDSRGRDTGALVAFPLGGGEPEVLHQDGRADVVDVLYHPSRGHAQAVAVEYARTEWTALDEAVAGDLATLDGLNEGDLEILSRSLDDRRWIVHFGFADGPGRYYLYDRERGTAEFLFVRRGALEGLPLSAMEPVIIEARDGLELVSYLTIPQRAASRAEDQPLSMVLLVHGGPWWRDRWGFNPLHQWLADRGYAVLSVNFRGSTGFGKAFINASNQEWGGAMHDDLIDAVRWAVDQGVADPERVAIMGASYGGYATLVGLTFTPQTFACGVNIVGVSNLITLLESIPPYWEPMRAMFTTRVGDPATPEGRELLRERSPLTHVEAIQRPLLIGHGAHDPRVKQQEADQIVDAMVARDIPVTYALYPDEGHGFARPANRLSFYAITEAFLSDCLGGRFEPVGEDFEGASLEIVEGASHIPRLAEILEARSEPAGDAPQDAPGVE